MTFVGLYFLIGALFLSFVASQPVFKETVAEERAKLNNAFLEGLMVLIGFLLIVILWLPIVLKVMVESGM